MLRTSINAGYANQLVVDPHELRVMQDRSKRINELKILSLSHTFSCGSESQLA